MIVWLIGYSKCTSHTYAVERFDKNQLCMFTGQNKREKDMPMHIHRSYS
jgi:hypothetical protein